MLKMLILEQKSDYRHLFLVVREPADYSNGEKNGLIADATVACESEVGGEKCIKNHPTIRYLYLYEKCA